MQANRDHPYMRGTSRNVDVNRRNNERSRNPPTSSVSTSPNLVMLSSSSADTTPPHPIAASQWEAEERNSMVNASHPTASMRFQHPPPGRNKKWGREPSHRNATALSHSLIQLNPGRGHFYWMPHPDPNPMNVSSVGVETRYQTHHICHTQAQATQGRSATPFGVGCSSTCPP